MFAAHWPSLGASETVNDCANAEFTPPIAKEQEQQKRKVLLHDFVDFNYLFFNELEFQVCVRGSMAQPRSLRDVAPIPH